VTARTVAKRLVGRSYFASKQYEMFRMRAKGAPVVVFSMGKTGSTAIARAVQAATGGRVFQVFRLESERLAQAEQRYLAGRTGSPATGAVPFPGALHLWESEYLLRHPPTAAAPWTVITTVREPIAQAVSAFFHGSVRRGLPADATIDQLAAELLDERWERAPVRWFDREFAPALGIDVFDRPFDPALGHGVIETAAARVLLLRQENLDAAPAALARFLGASAPVPVPVRNQATTKEYGEQYAEFLRSVRLPDPVLGEVYGSRYAQHFYADSELTGFRRRWRSGLVTG
jgi:Putative capsular polysaccharide synthesis protein